MHPVGAADDNPPREDAPLSSSNSNGNGAVPTVVGARREDSIPIVTSKNTPSLHRESPTTLDPPPPQAGPGVPDTEDPSGRTSKDPAPWGRSLVVESDHAAMHPAARSQDRQLGSGQAPIKIEDDEGESDDTQMGEGEGGLPRSSYGESLARDPAPVAPPLPTGQPADDPAHGYFAAPSGRLYTTFPDDSGTFRDTSGVPIPDGYQRWAAGDVEWHCPVRWCLSSHATRTGLGIHFGRIHRFQLFNDNLDGTLTEVGYKPADALLGARHDPIIIVSRRPGTLPPPTAAEIRSRGAAGRTRKPTAAKLNGAQSTTPRQGKQAGPVKADRHASPNTPEFHSSQYPNAQQTWDHIRPYLRHLGLSLDEAGIPQLLCLPKTRDLSWDTAWAHGNGFTDATPLELASIIAQVTGDKALRPCRLCREHFGPYAECVVIPKAARYGELAEVDTCANCLYHGQQDSCRFSRSTDQTPPQPEPYSSPYASSQGPSSIPSSIPSSQNPWQSGTPRTTHRLPLKGITQIYEPHRSESVLVEDVLSKLVNLDRLGSASANESGAQTPRGIKRIRAPSIEFEEYPRSQPSPPPASAEAPPRQVPAPAPTPDKTTGMGTVTTTTAMDYLEMEEWEIAPGRRKSSAPAGGRNAFGDRSPENIAFSKAYLADQTVAASSGVAFRVEIVRSGSSVRWESTGDRMRVYSVAAGKVQVRIEREDEFSIGQHGMFKVRCGSKCVVQNRRYGDAVLHITEFSDDS